MCYNIVVLGDPSVGKTSYLKKIKKIYEQGLELSMSQSGIDESVASISKEVFELELDTITDFKDRIYCNIVSILPSHADPLYLFRPTQRATS
jgi:GTPase SAR1 family protein